MQKTILQVPVNKQIKDDAEQAALGQGFSSLQEAVRIFLRKLSEDKISFTLEETVELSREAIKRYNKITRDVEAGRNVHEAKNVTDLVKQLSAR